MENGQEIREEVPGQLFRATPAEVAGAIRASQGRRDHGAVDAKEAVERVQESLSAPPNPGTLGGANVDLPGLVSAGKVKAGSLAPGGTMTDEEFKKAVDQYVIDKVRGYGLSEEGTARMLEGMGIEVGPVTGGRF
jgi:hypothetical protein